jgi:outer membrane protein OmpA-like peptidoglycan-associated protein
MKKISLILSPLIIFLLFSCGSNTSKNRTKNKISITDSTSLESNEESSLNQSESKTSTSSITKLNHNRQLIKLSHHINTAANEYLPVLSDDENKLYFSAMDRTGFFDFKVDFTKQKTAGGEDVFSSELKDGIWTDARPITFLNTNGHEIISQVFKNNNVLITANYPEKLGPKTANNGTETTDLFLAKKGKGNTFQIIHFPEPVNSIFDEADGLMAEDESYILFVSDRPGHVGEYQKKGWKWNSSFWGNTDVYVSIKDGDFWSVPVNLGKLVNTAGAERTPWLSKDGLTLFVSSNGQESNRTDLNVYAFKRTDKTNWTDWEGPIAITDANSDFDDWGYKETKLGNAYIAKVIPLGFKPTQGGTAGDGGIRETNYRTGYEIVGQQVASLNAENTTDIYYLKKSLEPVFTLPDVFFDFNSAKLKPSMLKVLDRLVDLIKQNKNYNLKIEGYTDDVGKDDYNLNLSQQRAEAVKNFLLENGVSNTITAKGLGESNPKYDNTNESVKAKNRRVDIYFITYN